MIDTHAHLDALNGSAHEALARARAVGVTRVITIGTRIDSCLAALALARDEGGVFAALGIHPHEAGEPEADRVRSSRPAPGRPCGRGRRDGARSLPGLRAARRSEPLVRCPPRARPELGLPVVIHSRAAGAETDATLRASTARSSYTASPSPSVCPSGTRPGELRLVCGERDVREGGCAASRSCGGSARPHPGGDRRAVSRSRAGTGRRTSPHSSPTRSAPSPPQGR